MAKSAKHDHGDPAREAPEAIADVAVAIELERRRLEGRLEAALNEHAMRTRQLAADQKSQGSKKVAKRRRQVDVAARKVAALDDKLTVLGRAGAGAPADASSADGAG